MKTNSYTVRYFPPGEECLDLKPLDIVLTRRKEGVFGLMIAWLTKGFYSHAALVYDGDYIVEALEWGVEIEHISKYKYNHFYAVISVDSSPEDKNQMLDFVNSVLFSKKQGYGYLMIVSIFLSLLTGMKINFGRSGTSICSGLVANTLIRSGVIFDKPPDYITPNDIAIMYQVNKNGKSPLK